MDSSSYGAQADVLGARFSVRAAEDVHLTFEGACDCGACWLLLLQPTQCGICTQGTAGTVH
jgi:hypothetical protein